MIKELLNIYDSFDKPALVLQIGIIPIVIIII